MPDMAVAGPPFWRYAKKALVAFGVGVVVSGGVIIAAAADDRITTSEWVQIILTVLGALFGAGGVYQVENATKAGSVVETRGELVHGQAPPMDGSAAAQRAYPPSPWDVPR